MAPQDGYAGAAGHGRRSRPRQIYPFSRTALHEQRVPGTDGGPSGRPPIRAGAPRCTQGERIGAIFRRVAGVVAALDNLTGMRHQSLAAALEEQQREIERYTAAQEEVVKPRLSAWLSEVNASMESLVGSKAAMLGEIRNRLGLPVPDGFVLTTEAYRQYAGIPLCRIRDAARDLDLNDLAALRHASDRLMAMARELPRAVEVAIAGRADTLLKNGGAGGPLQRRGRRRRAVVCRPVPQHSERAGGPGAGRV